MVWQQLRWNLPMWAVGTLTNWWPDNRVSSRVRGAMARPFMKKCGKNFQLGANVTLLNPDALEVGDDVYIARGTWLNSMGGLELEDEVVISPYVVISTLQHVFKGGSVRNGGSVAGQVKVGRGSWLAAHAAIKCGVTVGRGTLVAANACVVEDTPENVIVGGVPAKVIGNTSDGVADFHTRDEYADKRSD
jgi:acetyltransferase-like isoleucine patch superfamily enzyme